VSYYQCEERCSSLKHACETAFNVHFSPSDQGKWKNSVDNAKDEQIANAAPVGGQALTAQIDDHG
jgi:hypothetical protein